LFDGNAGKLEIAGSPGQGLVEKTRNAYELGRDSKDQPSPIWIQCLQVAGRRVGAIGFQGLSDSASIAAPLAMLAGAALERAESFQAASAAAAASRVESLRSAILDAFAHQFKTPLAAILTVAGGIRETHGLTPQQLEMIEMIEGETVRLGKLASRLLVTARLDRDEVQPRLEPTNLTDLITRLVDQCDTNAHQVSLDLGPAPIEVASDQELLILALAQLLDNAFKYSLPKSAVQIRLESQDGVASVRVSNQGSPVAPAERERIFERFYRGAAASRLAPGAGLGLYVGRKIAHAHAGCLELEEYEPDTLETTFSLKLPIWKAGSRHARKAS
jgi:two-component system sensor histidine kinase KdpD